MGGFSKKKKLQEGVGGSGSWFLHFNIFQGIIKWFKQKNFFAIFDDTPPLSMQFISRVDPRALNMCWIPDVEMSPTEYGKIPFNAFLCFEIFKHETPVENDSRRINSSKMFRPDASILLSGRVT